MELTQEYVKALFDYKDGILYRKTNLGNRFRIGEEAGYVKTSKIGKRRILKIHSKPYFSSRIIFLWHHGYLPEMVDHEDRNQLNDKIENLRPATSSQNNRNKTSAKGSSSQYLGVSWNRVRNVWMAQIRSNKVNKVLGSFTNEEDAAREYNKAAIGIHGEFANLNILKKT